MTKARAFLRWAGSKRGQLRRLCLFWNDHSRYIEPFAGSACLFFELAPKKAILGDNNSELMEVYRVVRDRPTGLCHRLGRIARDAETYYLWRKKNPDELDLETRVARFLYLNRNCFNGIFRTNTRGQFNVPIGTRTGTYFTMDDLQRCSLLLKRAKLVAADFGETIKHVRAGDFVYLDPPFAVDSRRVFRQYGARPFSTADIARLAVGLRDIARSGADFLVSYADSKEARALAKDWNAARLPIRRHVAGFGASRRRAFEWLISNMHVKDILRRSR